MTIPFLRPDLPAPSAFSVRELPHRAKLDQNESPVDLPPELKRSLGEALAVEPWNRYPQPARYRTAKAAFAHALGVEPERLFLTAGGDQTILCAFWAAGGPGRPALVFEPTYPMFAHYAEVTATPLRRVVLGPEMTLGPAAVAGPFALRCLVSPNNPTGTLVGQAVVEAALAAGGLTFVDEAYADFAGVSVAPLGAAHPNLLVGRSLSKSLLAGVRLGYALGDPAVVAACEHLFFAPYHLGLAQLVVAERYAEIRPHALAAAAAVRGERTRLATALGARGLRVFPSHANFLLFEIPNASAMAADLAARGVRIRDVSGLPGLSCHLRVTVGSPEENDRFLGALAGAQG